ncbi:MAG: hypothetical protein GX594_00635, partial [Pirellulaceae bacterium]|nr:hypothetical protein [Pirellulaceae bacterium]
PPSEREKANVVRAPQVAVAERIQPTLDALNDENWESSFYKMISVIHSDQSMDPILKANLLQQVLEVGVRGSYCLEKTFQGHCQWFNKERLNAFANWLDPNDAVANQARTTTAKALEDFPDIAQSGAMAAEDLKALRQRRVPEYRWVGWLHKTRDGRCECLMRQSPNQEGTLVTVFRSENPRFVTIGRYRGKAATIDTKAPLVMGRPVFLQIP